MCVHQQELQQHQNQHPLTFIRLDGGVGGWWWWWLWMDLLGQAENEEVVEMKRELFETAVATIHCVLLQIAFSAVDGRGGTCNLGGPRPCTVVG